MTIPIYERFDEYDIAITVEALDIMNPHGITAGDIKTLVASAVKHNEALPTTISTGGWCATNYTTGDGEIRWRVTLHPGVALSYAKKVRDVIHQIPV